MLSWCFLCRADRRIVLTRQAQRRIRLLLFSHPFHAPNKKQSDRSSAHTDRWRRKKNPQQHDEKRGRGGAFFTPQAPACPQGNSLMSPDYKIVRLYLGGSPELMNIRLHTSTPSELSISHSHIKQVRTKASALCVYSFIQEAIPFFFFLNVV